VRRRFPSFGRRIVGEGDPDRATLTSVELVHFTGHASRRLPPCHGTRIKEGAIDRRSGSVNVALDVGRAHFRLCPRYMVAKW
jgi:hypothetical protein